MFFGSSAVILASSCGFAVIFAAIGFNCCVDPVVGVVGAGDVELVPLVAGLTRVGAGLALGAWGCGVATGGRPCAPA